MPFSLVTEMANLKSLEIHYHTTHCDISSFCTFGVHFEDNTDNKIEEMQTIALSLEGLIVRKI